MGSIHSEGTLDNRSIIVDNDYYIYNNGTFIFDNNSIVTMDSGYGYTKSVMANPQSSDWLIPLYEENNVIFHNVGNGSIDVPAGTYFSEKYTNLVNGQEIDVWISSDVPIPLKWVVTEGNYTKTTELIGFK